MIRVAILFPLLTIAASCISSSVGSDSAGLAIQMTDRALEAPLRIERERVYLGELIETISRECRVDLRVEPQAPESADPLCVALRGVPARRVIGLLASLYSYKGAKWEWVKD